MTVAVAVLTAALLAAAGVSVVPVDRSRVQRAGAFGTVAFLGLLGLLAVASGSVTGRDSALARALLVVLFVVSVAGGSAVTATVLWLVDRGSSRPDDMDRAGEVLRGGVWIGVFERCAVFATLVAGWPEGLAVVLALKGLGRYSELRGTPPGVGASAGTTGPTGGVAERFIIGTFASVLWAIGCAGAYLTLVGA